MLTKKIFFILLFSLTTNIYSQSNEVKELQSEIDNWKNYSFNQYVYDSDRNQIFDRNNFLDFRSIFLLLSRKKL